MKKFVKAVCLAAGLMSAVGVAQAQDAFAVKPLVGTGLTFGGDELATLYYYDGSSAEIRAGQLFSFYGGAEFRFSSVMALQATVGYHFDRANAANGSVRFKRVPIDVVALYSVTDKVRLGAGIQHATNVKFSISGGFGGGSLAFKDSTGPLVEAEYLITPSIGAKGRYVSHKYKPSNGAPGSVDGSHFGLMLNVYF